MRWQFGGNFQPVRMICEIDWRECPAAIINYVWSEIVTDVVECLTNEWMMWRVIAMLFVCTLLIHTIYSKAKLMDKTTTNRDNLNVVGCKVQDLELKVNILTYKMQYGTWPLPRQIRGSGVERELRNVRLTLTNSNDRNAWLKHMLLSPRENAPCVPYAKIGPRSVRCLTKLINLETKYMSSRFAREASPLSQKENRSSSSEISTKCPRRDSRRSLVDAGSAKKEAKSENLEVRREESTTRACAKRPTSWSETGVTKCRESARTPPTRTTRDSCNEKRASRRSSRRDETPEERVNATSETLHEVRKKLEELHSVLRIYGSASGGNEQSGATNKRLAETILRDLKNLGDDLPESESDSKPRGSLDAENKAFDLPGKDHSEDTSEFEQCRSDFSSSSEIAKYRTTEEPEVARLPEAVKSSSSISAKRDANDRPEKSTSEEKCSLVEEAASAISSAAETSRDSDTDERSNAILLREALEFRSALVSRFELESSDRVGVEVADEASRAKLAFQPKYLDIISEEHSAGSSTEKSTRARELLGFGENRKCRESASSGLALASSSEYFSLSSIDLKDMIPREKATLQDDLSDLVNRSVRNIRDYVEAFSRLQNDAIAETRRAINDEDARVSPRESLDSITRFVNTLAITISEELPREMSEPAITSHARFVNSDEDTHGTSGCTRDFVLERRPGTISLTDKSFSLEEVASRVHDTIHESVDSDEPALSSEPSCKQLLRDYSEDTTSESIETRRVDTSLAILEDENFARREQDASRIVDSPLTGRTVVRATGSSIDNLGLSTCDSLESFEVRKNTNDDAKEVNLHDWEIRESNVVQETSSHYFTDQASFPDIEMKFFDLPVDRLTGIESNASIFDDTDRSYEKPETEATRGDLVDRREVGVKLENVEPEVALDSEDFNSEPEVRLEYENCGEPELESECFTAQAEVFERPEVHIETLVEQSEVAESDVSDEKPEVPSNRENIPENSDIKRESKNRNVTREVRLESESVPNEKPEVRADPGNLPENWAPRREDKNRSVAPEVRRERECTLTHKPEVKLKRESLNASSGRRENSPENSTSGGVPDANSDPSESELRENESNLSEEPSGIYVDASSREFLNLIGTNLEKRFSRATSSKSARGSSSSPLQQQKRSITRMLPRRGSSLDVVERSTTRPECSSKNREKIALSGRVDKTRGQTTKWTDIAIGEAGGSGLELPKRRSRSNATPRKSENSSTCQDIAESSEIRRLVGKRKNLEVEKSHEKVEKSRTPVRCASSGPSARNSRVDGEVEIVEMETSRSETGSRPSGAGSRPSRTGSRPSKTGSRPGATGSTASATRNGAFATGSGVSATGSGASAPGSGASTTGSGASAPGIVASATGSRALATGSGAFATGSGGFATGSGALATGNRAFATGSGALATGNRDFATGSGAYATESSSAVASSNTSNNRVAKETRSDDANVDIATKSERSALGRNSSRSCIPVLKSRLEAVRGNEKRAKSPARCPLTISTSSWNQENRSAAASTIRVDPKIDGSQANVTIEGSQTRETIESKSNENGASNDPEKWPDRRTVIYVNIVTEREQKSATRIVDPKKFLEYLKDRELKIQSVQDDVAKNNRCEIGVDSPRVLTVVSSAVDERTTDGGAAGRGSWSLRVERREIEVSAKPSVIDTSTSISDLPETQSLVLDNPKFQIFEVPKELTKDEYIVLLETLNRDPNLEQLREMHNLCDKLGLGFNE